MNKKGFTLVELLAVIAILAVLVIIALPNVLSMYNDARKNTFSNEVSSVLRTARQQYLVDGGGAREYTNADSHTNTLKLNGGKNLKYFVKLDGNGNVTELQATNGTYQYNKKGTIDIINSSDIVNINDLEEDEILVITGATNSNITELYGVISYSEDSSIPAGIQIYNSYQDVINATGKTSFIKYEYDNYELSSQSVWCLVHPEYGSSCDYGVYFDNETECNNDEGEGETCSIGTISIHTGTPVAAYVGFIKNGNVYYLKAVDNSTATFNNNTAVMNEAFGSSLCQLNVYGSGSYSCNDSVLNVVINPDGGISLFNEGNSINIGPIQIK